MTEIFFGGREAIEVSPATISLINGNSPLRWDDRLREAQFECSAANQPVAIAPFLLMGAMSPVSIPAPLVQQIAEATHRYRTLAIDQKGCAGDLRLVPVEHRDAVRLALFRHSRIRHRADLHGSDRTTVRATGALGRRPHVQPNERRFRADQSDERVVRAVGPRGGVT